MHGLGSLELENRMSLPNPPLTFAPLPLRENKRGAFPRRYGSYNVRVPTKMLTHIPGAIGVDEAGRGPLAGPCVVAAVRLPDGFDFEGLDDSKAIDHKRRESLEKRIRENAEHRLVVVGLEAIEKRNILHATLDAMEAAALGLDSGEGRILIDGDKTPFCLQSRAEAIVDGDATYACIAAASILAKTERDRIMTAYAAEYPAYGFDRHFGYATPEHLAALREHGPCPIHRITFRPICDMLAQPCLTFDA